MKRNMQTGGFCVENSKIAGITLHYYCNNQVRYHYRGSFYLQMDHEVPVSRLNNNSTAITLTAQIAFKEPLHNLFQYIGFLF